MRIVLLILICIFFVLVCNAQSIAIQKKVKNNFGDSSVVLLNAGIDHSLQESFGASEESTANQTFIPSVLNSNRDLFSATAAFHFNSRRFRLRGYSSNMFQANLNDIPMTQLVDGNTSWSSWGGLNEITNNNHVAIGLRDDDLSFGNLGSTTYIDLKASHLREQTTASFILSNRSYKFRLAFTKVVPFNKHGWAFAFSISKRYGNEVIIPGSYYNGNAYFLAIDKKINDHLFSFCIVGSQVINSRTAATVKELVSLTGTSAYSPSWGLQNGAIRNASLQKLFSPILILSHEYKTEDDISFNTSFSYSAGEKSVTGFDWYKAPDPRPDYYRYLPSFQKDTTLALQTTSLYTNNPDLLQVNWHRLYDVNRNSYATINDVNGISGNNLFINRSKYILEDRVEQSKKFAFSSRISQRVNDQLSIMANITYQVQIFRYFKRVNDLLGGRNYVDWNNFSDDVSPDASSLQNDLNIPNRLLSVGDHFGYNYQMNLQKLDAHGRLIYKVRRFDFFAGILLSELNFCRTGFMRNGVFPNNSFGKSINERFSSEAFKAGLTYKFNGRNYFFLNLALLSKPPTIADLYISPRTRDSKHSPVSMEKIATIEAGYILNAPTLKLRVTGYATQFKDGMNSMSFYHDGYRNLVNYLLWNINQLHIGIEFSAEYQLSNRLSATGTIGFGKYVYTNRQNYSVSIDNQEYTTEQGIIYTKNFPVPGIPQQAYSIGFTYRSPSSLLLSISSNYLSSYWLSFNPLRRTYDASRNLSTGNDFSSLTNPEKLTNVFVADLSAAYSFRLKKTSKGSYQFVQLFLGANNIFNQQIITGGYEQLRFDFDNASSQKFPNKYFYAQGANYALSIRLRF